LQGLNNRRQDVFWQYFSSVKLTDEVNVTKKLLLENKLLLLVVSMLLLFFLAKEFLEAIFTNIEKTLSEY